MYSNPKRRNPHVMLPDFRINNRNYYIEGFEYGLTFCGLGGHGVLPEINNCVLENTYPPSTWGRRPLLRIIDHDSVNSRVLPEYYFHAYLTSQSLSGEADASALILQWFGDRPLHIAPIELISRLVDEVVWEMCAEDFYRE